MKHGYLHEEPVLGRSDAGLAPGNRYEVNPLMGTQNPHNTQNSLTTMDDMSAQVQSIGNIDVEIGPFDGALPDGKEVA